MAQIDELRQRIDGLNTRLDAFEAWQAKVQALIDGAENANTGPDPKLNIVDDGEDDDFRKLHKEFQKPDAPQENDQQSDANTESGPSSPTPTGETSEDNDVTTGEGESENASPEIEKNENNG